MSTFKWLLLSIFVLAISFYACTLGQKQMEKELAGKSYGGITPCADCEGIALTIHFFANSRYESESMYIGESNEKFTREGYWEVKEDSSIVLKPEEGKRRQLKVYGSEFLILDHPREENNGKPSSKYMLRNIDHRPLMGSKHREENSTIDFKAHGNEPFWGLQIDMDSLISFKVVSGDSLGMAMKNVEMDSTGGLQTYRMKAAGDSLKIELHPIGCMDSMSGQVYDYRARVTYREKNYSGCGGYVK